MKKKMATWSGGGGYLLVGGAWDTCWNWRSRRLMGNSMPNGAILITDLPEEWKYEVPG